MCVGPQYLQNLIERVSSVAGRGTLRSAKRGKLILPKFRTENFGRRRFSVAATEVWNALPADVIDVIEDKNAFGKKLKQDFFNK